MYCTSITSPVYIGKSVALYVIVTVSAVATKSVADLNLAPFLYTNNLASVVPAVKQANP